MYRSGDCQSWQQNGWDTSSQEYHEHLTRIARSPSIHPNVPQYPNVHPAFHQKVTYEEESECLQSQNQHQHQHQHQHHHHPPQFQEKVEVMKFEEERFGRNRNDEFVMVEEVVEVRSDGYVPPKHRGFELCKWDT
ncbi:hypothetical protein EUGRSUZ_B00219 [Eucalyptus grandis]|uniref:Uncharacterized protein n=2 Tax=Eucalyptus grandis TaxID=71139 RepID=A0ACC3LM04_EUCGR|nr:hypothetical protein EUGRSUZ_B00219 [Eucalyptus grandis]